MKSVVADYRYRVLCMKIVPVVAPTIYLTDYIHDLVMSGHTYISTSGYQFTGYNSTSDFAPASIDIEGIAGVAGISQGGDLQRPVRRGTMLCFCHGLDESGGR
jgi:hypothetical protein